MLSGATWDARKCTGCQNLGLPEAGGTGSWGSLMGLTPSPAGQPRPPHPAPPLWAPAAHMGLIPWVPAGVSVTREVSPVIRGETGKAV